MQLSPYHDDQYGYNYDHPDYADNSNYFFYRCDLYFNIALAVLIVIFLIVIVYKMYELYFSGSDDDGSVTYVVIINEVNKTARCQDLPEWRTILLPIYFTNHRSPIYNCRLGFFTTVYTRSSMEL